MTDNQLRYQANLETERSNRANERIARSKANAEKKHFERSDSEVARSNLARELENNRHNVSAESENVRHNTATEALTGIQQAETHRSNVASEQQKRSELAESMRHNIESEGIQREQNAVRKYAARVKNPTAAVVVDSAYNVGKAAEALRDYEHSTHTGSKLVESVKEGLRSLQGSLGYNPPRKTTQSKPSMITTSKLLTGGKRK